MTTDLYLFATLYRRLLDVVSHLLDKGEAHAAGLGGAEGPMLDWRLIEDMHPLRFQLTVVVNFARQWPARAAGIAVPEFDRLRAVAGGVSHGDLGRQGLSRRSHRRAVRRPERHAAHRRTR